MDEVWDARGNHAVEEMPIPEPEVGLSSMKEEEDPFYDAIEPPDLFNCSDEDIQFELGLVGAGLGGGFENTAEL